MGTLHILWLVLLAAKIGMNEDVYRKQGKEDLYYGDSRIFGKTIGGVVLLIFTFWWSKEDMLEDPDQKKDMVAANVCNVLFFLLTAIIVAGWIVTIVKRNQVA
jgi:cytochrome bd-type quinol oxidase subunit 1